MVEESYSYRRSEVLRNSASGTLKPHSLVSPISILHSTRLLHNTHFTGLTCAIECRGTAEKIVSAMPENERPVGTAGNASSSGRTGRRKKASSQIYVLSADGSKLFLLDPSTPEGHEEPPAYHTIHSPASASSSVLPHADTGDDGIRNNPWSSFSANEESIAGPSSPRSVTVHELPSIRSSADIYRTRSASIHGRNRANTTSASRPQRTHFRRTISAGNTPRRAMSVRTQSYGDLGPTDHFEGRATAAAFEANETLPLLQDGGGQPRRGALGSIFCGELEEGDGLGTWGDAWRRFWRPVGSGQYWRAVLHLVVLNFPFVSRFPTCNWLPRGLSTA